MDPPATRQPAFRTAYIDMMSRRVPVSVASRRLRALATLSGSLTDPLDPDVAARLVEVEALAALGANGAVVVTLGTFPYVGSLQSVEPPAADARLHLIQAIGVPNEAAAAMQEMPLDAPVPFAEVARSGEPMFMEQSSDLEACGEWGETMLRAGAQAYAIVPVWANGELRGVLGLSWPEQHDFDEDERAFVITLGVMCAQAILRSHLRLAESKARDAAEHANRSKANFLTMISHELRTPMNAVIGYSELISEGMDGPVTARQSEHLARMQSSSTHLLALIEELLGYARLEAGQDLVVPEHVPLLEAIEHTLELIRPLAEKKGLRMRVETPETPVVLYTDARKLRQILVNLLANAVKFTENGEVTLIVTIDGVEEAVRIVFEVTDSGPGIPPGAQEHIFNAFWQKDPGSALASGGTGLGLPIARQLARLLGGDVELVQSAESVGSTFVVSLPLRYDAAQQRT